MLKLIDVVRERVAERLGIDLEREIEIWFTGPAPGARLPAVQRLPSLRLEIQLLACRG